MGMVVWVREVGSGVRSAAVGRLGMGIWKGTSSRSSTTPHKAYFTPGRDAPAQQAAQSQHRQNEHRRGHKPLQQGVHCFSASFKMAYRASISS